jgi:hypothetical protein
MRIGILAVAVLVAAMSLVGCSGDEAPAPAPVPQVQVEPDASVATLPAAGPEAADSGLTVQVVGECGQPGSKGLRLKASGFTPNGQYMTEAYYPDGKRYTYLLNGGYGAAATDGSAPSWSWECYLGPNNTQDPPGEYKLTMHDVPTGRSVSTTFTVAYEGG